MVTPINNSPPPPRSAIRSPRGSVTPVPSMPNLRKPQQSVTAVPALSLPRRPGGPGGGNRETASEGPFGGQSDSAKMVSLLEEIAHGGERRREMETTESAMPDGPEREDRWKAMFNDRLIEEDEFGNAIVRR